MEKKVIIDNCEFIYNYLYPFDSETFYKFIEDKTKVQRDFFWFDEINDHMILKWKYSNFKKDFKSFYANNMEFKVPIKILLESNVIKTILYDSDDDKEKNIMEETDDTKLVFNHNDRLNRVSINDWFTLSCLIDESFQKKGENFKNLSIPKPLTNNKLFVYIGLPAYNYLDQMLLTNLESLASLADFLDIQYILESVCAFIAEKYVKNNSIENIKTIFGDLCD